MTRHGLNLLSCNSCQTRALDSTYYFNRQVSQHIFWTPEVAKGTSRDTRDFLREYSSTGTDKNFGSAITMDKHLVHIYYTGTLREYSAIAGSRCHRTAYNRSTAQSEIRPAIYPIHVLRRYKIPPTPSIPKRRLPSASHFLLLPSL